MSETHNCGSCVSMRKTDGYCRRTGKYVNALAEQSCWLGSREEARQNLPTIGPQEVPPTRYGEHGSYLVPEGTKYCPACKTVKPLSEFGVNRNSADGYNHYCKDCFNERMAQVRAAHREERAATAERIARKEPAPKKAKQPAAVGIDWSTFRREAAKDILGAIIAKKSSFCSYEEVVKEAIRFADELIEQLKEGRNS